jgi:hypothetical protein
MIDDNGDWLPTELWHGSESGVYPQVLRPAAEVGGWWRIIDPAKFQLLEDENLDADEHCELDHECRTACGNIAFDALKLSDDPRHQKIASEYGLERLGDAVSILFVSTDRQYVENTYGPAIEIDAEADGLLMAIYDQNALKADSWMLVFESGAKFPVKNGPALSL